MIQQRVVLIALAFLCGCSGGSTRPAEPPPPKKTSFDLSTDDGVRKAYLEATGRNRAYIHRSDRLPGIVVINDRIPDLGDRFVGVFVDGRWYPDGKELGPVLESLAWKTTDSNGRVEIVRKWVEGSARYGSVIDKPVSPGPVPDPTPNPGIKPAEYTATADGGVRADFWVVTGWNIAGKPMYEHRTLTFDADGVHIR